MGKTFQFGRPELAEEVERRWDQGGSKREMERLQAVRLAMKGEHTLEAIGEAVGRARSRIGEWMKIVREEGLAALLQRHQGRGRAPQVHGRAFAELRKGVRRGRWKRALEAQHWLEQRYGLHLSLNGMRY